RCTGVAKCHELRRCGHTFGTSPARNSLAPRPRAAAHGVHPDNSVSWGNANLPRDPPPAGRADTCPGPQPLSPARVRDGAKGFEEASMSAVSNKVLQRSLAAALLATGLALVVAPVAKAGEIIPSMAWTKTPDAGGETAISYGLALRGSLVPMVAAEIGL